jgi:hypothetical protein
MLSTLSKNNLKMFSTNSTKELHTRINWKASLINKSLIKFMPLQTKLKDKTNFSYNTSKKREA